MIRRVFSLFSMGLLVLVPALPVSATQLSVSLDPVSFGNSGQVKFKVFPGDPIGTPAPPLNPDYGYQTSDHSYSIFLDPDSVVADPKFNSFSFNLFVKAAGDGTSYVFNVLGDPTGNFTDSLSDVTIKIQGSAAEPSVGTIKVPLHSPGYDGALLQVTDPREPFLDVKLSDKDPPAVTLRNTLESFPIQVTHVGLRPGCEACWAVGSPSNSGLQIAANSEAPYQLSLTPRIVGALLATAFILKRDSPHDVIYADVSYNVGEGGMPRQKSLKLNIKFSPSFWELALAVLAGALIGTILRRVLDPDHTKFSKKLLFQSLFIAVVAEFVAVVAASFDSKLVLLGFDMDPRQFVPALILAGLTAGGPVVAKWLGKAATGGAAAADAGGGD